MTDQSEAQQANSLKPDQLMADQQSQAEVQHSDVEGDELEVEVDAVWTIAVQDESNQDNRCHNEHRQHAGQKRIDGDSVENASITEAVDARHELSR